MKHKKRSRVIIHQENANLGELKLQQLFLPSIGEDVENLGPPFTADRNEKWHNHFGKQFGHFLMG